MFSDEKLKRLKDHALLPTRDMILLSHGELLALIARLELAEQKDCNQYHCGHATCNAWREAFGREEGR